MVNRRKLAIIVPALILVVATLITFAIVYAAAKNLEAEAGSIAGSATVLSDSSASGGHAVRFGTSTLSIPTLATIGPRCTPTETISRDEALTRLRNTGTLSCVTVTGSFRLSGSDGIGWVIEDVLFINGGSLYGIQAYSGLDAYTGTLAERAIFRYVEVRGNGSASGSGCGAAVYARNIIMEYANIYGCSDGIKPSSNFTLQYSWVHDLDHPSGAHSDAVQIVSGTGLVFHGNRFDAYVGYSSDGSSTPDGSTGSGMLQTGTVTNNIQAVWTNNWFAGGHYTVRGSNDMTYNIDYLFRNNRFLRYGTSVALGLTNLEPNRYGPLYQMGSADFDCSNVWDDTAIPVAGSC